MQIGSDIFQPARAGTHVGQRFTRMLTGKHIRSRGSPIWRCIVDLFFDLEAKSERGNTGKHFLFQKKGATCQEYK
jgi:hypothetical protein